MKSGGCTTSRDPEPVNTAAAVRRNKLQADNDSAEDDSEIPTPKRVPYHRRQCGNSTQNSYFGPPQAAKSRDNLSCDDRWQPKDSKKSHGDSKLKPVSNSLRRSSFQPTPCDKYNVQANHVHKTGSNKSIDNSRLNVCPYPEMFNRSTSNLAVQIFWQK